MKTPKRRGRPAEPIERDPQRFELACWWAFHEMGCGPFDAARRALLATKGGPITLEDIEGTLVMASASIPLPQPFDPLDPDKGLRRLSAKAKRAKPARWLVASSGLVRALITFIANNNMTGIAAACDGLIKLGWGPTIMGLADRVEAALGSNLPPADLERPCAGCWPGWPWSRPKKNEASNLITLGAKGSLRAYNHDAVPHHLAFPCRTGRPPRPGAGPAPGRRKLRRHWQDVWNFADARPADRAPGKTPGHCARARWLRCAVVRARDQPACRASKTYDR